MHSVLFRKLKSLDLQSPQQSNILIPITSLFLLIIMMVMVLPVSCNAHGVVGNRLFPTTFAVEDPFVSDEFSLLFNSRKKPGEGDTPTFRETAFLAEYSKRITPSFGLSLGTDYRYQKPEDGDSVSGFGNFEVGAKYQIFTNAPHEMVISLGVSAEIGGTGAKRVGSESFSVISPAVFFGKGFGDLPESLKYLRPLAITGAIGLNFPTRSKNVTVTVNEDTGEAEQEIERIPRTLSWGFTVQYSLQYLQSFVKDIGLGAPFNRMVIVAEFPMETCMNTECRGKTTGTFNPGIVWMGRTMMLGVAAQIPINTSSGRNVGWFGLIHFMLDDLFPQSIGKPLFK
jgi:hypothetical protein